MVKDDAAAVNELAVTALVDAIDGLCSGQEKLIKKVRKIKFKQKVYVVATMGAVYYIYNKLDARLKKLEGNEVKNNPME